MMWVYLGKKKISSSQSVHRVLDLHYSHYHGECFQLDNEV